MNVTQFLSPLALLTLTASPALASAPMSVWATLDRVQVEQLRDQRPRLVLEGTFITREGRKPVPGRLVYECAEADPSICLAAWVDLTQAARSGACVGWGQPAAHDPTPAPLAAPMPPALTWPVGIGVAQSKWRCQVER